MLDRLRAQVRPLGLGFAYLQARRFLQNAAIKTRLGKPDLILFTHKAYGDTLLLSAVTRALAKNGVKRVVVATRHRDLFANNPDITRLYLRTTAECLPLLGIVTGLKFIHYSVPTNTPHFYVPPPEHIISVMCRNAGVTGKIELLPRLYLSQFELAKFKTQKETIVVQSSIANAGWPILNKEWYPDRMQAVVDALKLKFKVVQVGVREDVPLRGVVDLRGRLQIREVASLLANSRAFVGLVGFLMHLARALDCPSVIVYGGREAPWQTGYTCNENIYRQVNCAPCWREDICPEGKHCMDSIDSNDVLDAVKALLARSRTLTIDAALIV